MCSTGAVFWKPRITAVRPERRIASISSTLVACAALWAVSGSAMADITIGVSLLLAASTTYFRDVRHFVEIALLMLFWTTPVVYPLSQVPGWLRVPILLSPMSPFILSYHALFFDGVMPDASTWAVAVAYGLTTLALGTVWFVSVEDDLSEYL